MSTHTPTHPGRGVDTALATLEATIDARLEQLARREHLRALGRLVAMGCLPAAVVALAALAVF